MRLGSIQRIIFEYLSQFPNGAAICSTTKASCFGGLDLDQVERALDRLLQRRIIRRESVRYILNKESNNV